MSGCIWMFSDQIDDVDLEFAQHDFITYRMGREYYGLGEKPMIRILQCVNNMHRAGLETLLMNYYRHIDREQIQFDFLMHRAQRSDYDDEIESMGGRIFLY